MAPGAQTELGLLEATLRIRAFETAANQRYLSAKMPGLTPLRRRRGGRFLDTLAGFAEEPARLVR